MRKLLAMVLVACGLVWSCGDGEGGRQQPQGQPVNQPAKPRVEQQEPMGGQPKQYPAPDSCAAWMIQQSLQELGFWAQALTNNEPDAERRCQEYMETTAVPLITE